MEFIGVRTFEPAHQNSSNANPQILTTLIWVKQAVNTHDKCPRLTCAGRANHKMLKMLKRVLR